MFNILVSAVNCEKYLEDCLNSIVSQDIKCEIILINPYPSRVYNEIKKKFYQNIYFEINEPDEGCADGLNHGLKYINNPYICVLNGDDYFLRNSLNAVAKELKTKPDILIGNGLIVDSNKYLIKKSIANRFSAEKLIIGQATVPHLATFYSKKIFDEGIKFNKNNTTVWDSEILLDVYLRNYHFKYINDFIGAFRLYSGSISDMLQNKQSKKTVALQKAVVLQQSLYFERIKGRKINIFDKIWLFIIKRAYMIIKIPKKIKEIFEKRIKII